MVGKKASLGQELLTSLTSKLRSLPAPFVSGAGAELGVQGEDSLLAFKENPRSASEIQKKEKNQSRY